MLIIYILFSILSVSILEATSSSLYSSCISRKGFQGLCRFTYDPYVDTSIVEWASKSGGATFNPSHVQPGDIIFVRQVDNFFKQKHPKIKNPYIIITHGDYRDAFLPAYAKYLDSPKVIAWFAIHAGISNHAKFYPIPLGIFQGIEQVVNKTEIDRFLKTVRNTTLKDKLLYINFDVKTSQPERASLVEQFSNKNYCVITNWKPFNSYIMEMAHFKFTLSPPGLAIDCYRTWEALVVGSIPIVKSSHLNSVYRHLPVLIVNDWQEITKEFLERKYDEMSRKHYNLDKLYMGYWKHKIRLVRDNYLFKYYGR